MQKRITHVGVGGVILIKRTKKLTAIFLIAVLTFFTVVLSCYYNISAKADTITEHKFDIERFANDFKWTTYSYELVSSEMPSFGGENSEYTTRPEMTDYLNNVLGITFDYALVNKGYGRIVVNGIGGGLYVDYDQLKKNVDCDLIEVQLVCDLGNTVDMYSMVAKVVANGCVIDFSKLSIDSAYVYSINFYKTKIINSGNTSWKLGLYLPNDTSDLKLYSEYFIPSEGYYLMYSTYMENGSGSIGNSFGAYYGTIDALNLSNEKSYNLTSAGFPSSQSYEIELATYNTNYNRYNSAYKTLINVNGVVDYTCTNLDKYYGYDDVIEVNSSSSISTSVEPSTSDEPSTSAEPSISAEPSTSDEPITSEEPSTSNDGENQSSGNDPITERIVTVKDYEGNSIGSIVVGEDKNITLEEVEFIINGAFETPLKFEFLDIETLNEGDFSFDTVIENDITLWPKKVLITVFDENSTKVKEFDIPFGKVIDVAYINTQVGSDYSDKYMVKVVDSVYEYNFSNAIIYDLDLYPLVHKVTIFDNSDIDENGAGNVLASAVVKNNVTINDDFINLYLSDKYNFSIEIIDVIDLTKKSVERVSAGYVVNKENSQDIHIHLGDISVNDNNDDELPPNDDDVPSTSSDDGETSKDENGNIPIDEIGDNGNGGCKHKFTFAPWQFPCALCGISIWAMLKSYVIGGVIGLAIILGISFLIMIRK